MWVWLLSKVEGQRSFKNQWINLIENDLLFVSKIYKWSRDILKFLKLQAKLFKKKFNFVFLDLTYSNEVEVNRLIIPNIDIITIFDNERWKERKRQRIQATKKNIKSFDLKSITNKN